MQRLLDTNMEQNPGYSEDKHCDEARELIKKLCQAP
jgi:threonine aldolase